MAEAGVGTADGEEVGPRGATVAEGPGVLGLDGARWGSHRPIARSKFCTARGIGTRGKPSGRRVNPFQCRIPQIAAAPRSAKTIRSVPQPEYPKRKRRVFFRADIF